LNFSDSAWRGLRTGEPVLGEKYGAGPRLILLLIVNGANHTVTLPGLEEAQFFRLQLPGKPCELMALGGDLFYPVV
jgi:hypothetical protein